MKVSARLVDRAGTALELEIYAYVLCGFRIYFDIILQLIFQYRRHYCIEQKILFLIPTIK